MGILLKRKLSEGDMFTCIDMHENSKINQSFFVRKFDRVFENSNMKHLANTRSHFRTETECFI